MFNGTKFNLTAFNIQTDVYSLAQALLSGLGAIYPSAKIEAAAQTLLSGLGTIHLALTEEGQILMSGMGGLSAEALKELLAETLLSGVGSVYPTASKYEVKSITVTGDFAVGDTIIIDMDKFTVTLNGANALSSITNDFFNLDVGENEITYTDSSSSRTVKLTVVYRDRWV